MVEFNWTSYVAIQTYLSTELNSLANDGNKLGAAIDNSTNRDFYLDVEVYLASVDLSVQTNPAIYIYLVKSLDDTNYEDGSDSVDPAKAPTQVIALRVVNATQRRVTETPIVIPPGSFKLLIENKAGAALASSGNTVKYRKFSEESN
jgi:hypothetical protein